MMGVHFGCVQDLCPRAPAEVSRFLCPTMTEQWTMDTKTDIEIEFIKKRKVFPR